MSTTAIPIDDELLAILGREGEDPARALQEAAVMDLFRMGAISRGRGAQILGIDLLAFMRAASARGIPVFDAEPEEFDADLERARGLLGR